MVGEMLTPQDVDLLQGLGFGVLWNRAIAHTGYNPPGFATILVALPEEGWGAIVLTNGDGGIALRHEIMRSLAEEYGLLPPTGLIIAAGISLLLVLATPTLASSQVNRCGNCAENGKTSDSCPHRCRFGNDRDLLGHMPLRGLFHGSSRSNGLEWRDSFGQDAPRTGARLCFAFSRPIGRVHYTLFTIAVLIGVYLGYKFGHTAVVMFAVASGVG
jgi:hypothetical protein